MKLMMLGAFCVATAFSGDFSNTPVTLEKSEQNATDYLAEMEYHTRVTEFWLLSVTKQLYDVENAFNYVSVPAVISSILVGLALILKAVRGIRSKKIDSNRESIIIHPDETYNLRQHTYV